MGANQSLIRFGAITPLHEQKRQLFYYTLWNGIFLSFVLMISTWLAIPIIAQNMPGSQEFIFILAIQLVTLLFFENLKGYFRILRLNKPFALFEITVSILLLLLGIAGIFIAGGVGYAWAIVIAPLIGFILFFFKLPPPLRKLSWHKTTIHKGFWKYGFFAGLGAMTSQLLYTVDILILGNLQSDAAVVAQYKVASLIPLSLLLVPLAFINTDYVKIASNSRNPNYLKYYASHYLKVFSLASGLIGAMLYFFSGFILTTLFGEQYSDGQMLFQIFIAGLIGGILFRVPFGNILSALGKANWNSGIAIFVLLINIGLDYLLIKWYGALGAAIATTSIIWLSGFLSFIAFLYYLGKLKQGRL